ncbi:MAG: copper chaperone PCu(A)C [Rhodospirillales bacterium]|jgi:hypothetical protein|nr:copper chaperone PCu(A)C [Rhodospirillales bacterium]
MILVAAMGAAFPAAADDTPLGALTIGDAWSRASAGPAKAGAAYVTITNNGAEADRLVGAATPVAKKAAVHTHLMRDGVMKMRPVEAVEVNPGEPTVFMPGGLHVMLMGLKAPLVEGDTFPLTLTFERSGTVEVRVRVFGVGATRHPMHHKMGGSGS